MNGANYTAANLAAAERAMAELERRITRLQDAPAGNSTLLVVHLLDTMHALRLRCDAMRAALRCGGGGDRRYAVA